MTGALRAFVVLTLGGLLCACDTGATAPSASDLVGRDFVSTEVVGTPIPGGGPFTLAFPARERVAAYAGCNRMMGTADFSGGVVHADGLATTMMACPPPLDEADRWVQKLFAARPRWHLDGDVLTLATDNLRVTLVEQSADR
jgi:heat shock protein HslJ